MEWTKFRQTLAVGVLEAKINWLDFKGPGFKVKVATTLQGHVEEYSQIDSE